MLIIRKDAARFATLYDL